MMVVSGPVSYDLVGRAIKPFYPLTETLGPAGKFNPGVDTVQPTVMTYDVLDRMLTTTLPDDTVTRTDYGFGPDRNGQVQPCRVGKRPFVGPPFILGMGGQ